MKKPIPTIRKGDVLVIYGYDSVLHVDKFTTSSTSKEMTSVDGITFTKKGWGIVPRDLHYETVRRGELISDSLPSGYEKEIKKRGCFWQLQLEVVRPKRRK